MRRIFVALHGPDGAAALLDLAAHVASAFDARIEAAFIGEIASADEEAASDTPEAAAGRRAYETLSAANSADGGPSVAWREISDGVVYASAALGRASDLIVTRSARRVLEERILNGGSGARSFRDALLASGRLTLLAPAGGPGVSGLLDRVVIAWDGSAAATHALAQSLPLLARAKSVQVVIVGRNTVGETAREAIESYVAMHHPGARLQVRDNAHRQTGRVLLDMLREQAASLVVMGVSGRSGAQGGASPGGTMLNVIEDGRIPILTAV